MKSISIDFSQCKYPMDIHCEIKEKLKLPEWYGNNSDALWDMLVGFISTPIEITVIFKPEKEVSKNLKESVLRIIEIFKEAAAEDVEIKLNIEL
ncbi:MAG: barstar family protein [Clostridia bacterium]|nr:barstar family protein [Clostridia bacterium]